MIVPQRSVPAYLIEPKVKNRSRVYYQMANLQAHRVDPHAFPLLTDDRGFITEGSGSNFFIVRQGRGAHRQEATIFWWACRATLSWTC